MKKIGIIGAGAWGTALAVSSSNAGNEVLLWSHGEKVVQSINNYHENKRYLSGIKLPASIKATDNLAEVVESDMLLMVIPAQKLREVCLNIKTVFLKNSVPLVICCKGIEQGTRKLMSEVIAEILPDNPVAVLSGPNFAAEIAKGLPACATLACTDEKLGTELVNILASQSFRLYYSQDVVGAQIGGAVKNVIAIACGIAIGRGLGENAGAALVTRGMAEISRLCAAKGGKHSTLMGLSGIGDIMLTCGSSTSRNMSLGIALGGGQPLSNQLTEGVATAASVAELAASLKIDMPICMAINDILHKGIDIDITIKSLLQRPFAVEL
ncbi:MAG: glycerol-3-phosphate acyltransferase [Rickettsiaceae bacterium]|jgi:glycerol-3-phosphate dehydrogenase (NAD(P)+)|nr:glycerol-3-phosphate acyltransferase [Rickettsiaceae bacterium]